MAKLDYLLMTSAVEPSSDTPFLALLDPNVRFRQTITSIERWSKSSKRLGFKVVVTDNTGWAHKIESVTSKCFLPGNLIVLDAPRPSGLVISRGKGAAEAENLIWTLEQLHLPATAVVAKVNARYFASNGNLLVDRLTQDFDFAAWPGEKLDWVDTTFFVGKVAFLSQLFPRILNEVDDIKGVFFERLAAEFSINNAHCDYQRFDYKPAIVGQSGTTGAFASPFNEARLVSSIIRALILMKKAIPFIEPNSYWKKS